MNDDKVKISAVETFNSYLAGRRMRRTPERFVVLEVVLSTSGRFTIAELTESVELGGSLAVSRATVYNTVQLLLDCGVLTRRQIAGKPTVYELVARTDYRHLNLVCTMCGKVREVRDVELAEAIRSRRYETFTPSHFTLNIYGLCSRCQRRRRRRGSPKD